MTTYHPNGLHDEAGGAEAGEASMTERARARLDAGIDDTKAAADAVRKQATDLARSTSEQGAQFVRDNPAAALAGAVGLGILIGLAVRGRR